MDDWNMLCGETTSPCMDQPISTEGCPRIAGRRSIFRALPPYPGGKRSLIGEIFKHVPSPREAPVFVDAFLGGGAVSLYAKARGYQVLCNDLAPRSYVVGRALIENDRVTISTEDLTRLFVPNDAATDFVEKNFTPDVFVPKHSRFMDRAVANIREMEGEKQWLMMLLLVKYIFRMRPHGNFGARTIIHQLAENRWEEMNPHYVREALNRRINSHPMRNAELIASDINKGVFSNGRKNQVFMQDVFEFLGHAHGDVVYFDPPYAGTQSYENALKVIDDILRGERYQAEPSVFSQGGALDALDRMLQKARHIPLVILSYGNSEFGLDELATLLKRHRSHVEAREIEYVHCSGLSGDEKREKNREFILVGKY